VCQNCVVRKFTLYSAVNDAPSKEYFTIVREKAQIRLCHQMQGYKGILAS
jgi:hypothetical protein